MLKLRMPISRCLLPLAIVTASGPVFAADPVAEPSPEITPLTVQGSAVAAMNGSITPDRDGPEIGQATQAESGEAGQESTAESSGSADEPEAEPIQDAPEPAKPAAKKKHCPITSSCGYQPVLAHLIITRDLAIPGAPAMALRLIPTKSALGGGSQAPIVLKPRVVGSNWVGLDIAGRF